VVSVCAVELQESFQFRRDFPAAAIAIVMRVVNLVNCDRPRERQRVDSLSSVVTVNLLLQRRPVWVAVQLEHPKNNVKIRFRFTQLLVNPPTVTVKAFTDKRPTHEHCF